MIVNSFVPHTVDKYMHTGSEAGLQHYVLMHKKKKMMLHFN